MQQEDIFPAWETAPAKSLRTETSCQETTKIKNPADKTTWYTSQLKRGGTWMPDLYRQDSKGRG